MFVHVRAKKVASTLPGASSQNWAFTLIELLVAMSVLTVIVLLMTQAFSGLTSTVSLSTARIESGSAVRDVLDRIGSDIKAMTKGGGFTPIFNANAKGYNDSIAFLSGVRSLNTGNDATVAANTRFAGICYAIAPATADVTLGTAESTALGAQPMLMRAAVPFLWTDDLSSFTSTQAGSATAATVVNNKFQTFSPDIFRMEVYFQLTDGTLSSSLPTATTTPPGSTTAVSVVDLSIVKSIHFAFAVLDADTRKKMSAAQITSLCGDIAGNTPGFLQDFVAASYTSASSTTPVTIWTNQLTATSSGIAPVALKTIRFYERSYDLQ